MNGIRSSTTDPGPSAEQADWSAWRDFATPEPGVDAPTLVGRERVGAANAFDAFASAMADSARTHGPPAPPPAAFSTAAHEPSGRELVDRHTRGDRTDVKAVAADLCDEIRQRPNEATRLTMEALEQVKADDRDELAQEFVRAHSDAELKTLGESAAGKGALALAVNELSKGDIHKDEADDARRVGKALGTEIDIQVNAGWSWERVSGAVHTALDLAGFIPGLGAIPDLINAGIYAAEGDKLNAGISLGAAVPVIGDAAKGGTMIVKGGKEVLEAGAKKAAREVAEAASEKAVKEGLEAAGKQGDEVAQAAGKDVVRGAVKATPDAKGLINGLHNAGPNAPRFDKWVEGGGSVLFDKATDTYVYSKSIETSNEGIKQVEIAYRKGADGVARPDLSAYTRDSVQVPTTLPKSYPEHFKAANEALGSKLRADPALAQRLGLSDEQVALITKQPPSAKSPPNLTWHHGDNGAMHLVDQNVHGTFTHHGGMASW